MVVGALVGAAAGVRGGTALRQLPPDLDGPLAEFYLRAHKGARSDRRQRVLRTPKELHTNDDGMSSCGILPEQKGGAAPTLAPPPLSLTLSPLPHLFHIQSI